jgi:ParB/RepB/Spo0J family partition protein
MTTSSFENAPDVLFSEEEDGGDTLYQPAKMKDIARRLTFVLFDEIVEDSPTQARLEIFDPAKNKEDQELLSSIMANGIITPLIVRRIDDGKNGQGKRRFALVAGHRRVAAGKLAGLRGTEGVVSLPDEDHHVITVAENIGRRELSSFEKGLSLQSLKEQRNFTVRKIAEATGLSRSYVGELLQALQSPKELVNIWAEDALTAKAIVLLKDHWSLFEQKETAPLLKDLRGLTREQAGDLNIQLNAGTPLKKALAVLISPTKINKKASGKAVPKKAASDQDLAGIPRDELLTAISEVFPKINGKKARSLYDYTVVNGVLNPEILWAAALYVDRGGQINQAVALTKQAFGTRKLKKLLVLQVKIMKGVALHLDTMTKEDKSIIDFTNIIFSSRR